MKKLMLLPLLIGFLAYFISCTKEKTPLSIISAECPDTVKFSTQIKPMIDTYCASCHASGTSPALVDFKSVRSNADQILKSIKNEIKLMPDGGPALHDSLIQQFSCWIFQGKMNN